MPAACLPTVRASLTTGPRRDRVAGASGHEGAVQRSRRRGRPRAWPAAGRAERTNLNTAITVPDWGQPVRMLPFQRPVAPQLRSNAGRGEQIGVPNRGRDSTTGSPASTCWPRSSSTGNTLKLGDADTGLKGGGRRVCHGAPATAASVESGRAPSSVAGSTRDSSSWPGCGSARRAPSAGPTSPTRSTATGSSSPSAAARGRDEGARRRRIRSCRSRRRWWGWWPAASRGDRPLGPGEAGVGADEPGRVDPPT